MYIVTTLAEPSSACNFQPPFSSAERNITENDARHIFAILGGPSPWQQYLARNLRAHAKDLPARPMRIVTDAEFANRYNGVFRRPPPADAQGFVDRRNATIFLREFPARNFNQTKAGLALHEAVHLFSHPPGRSNQSRATVYALLEEGLLEGLTQIITEDIQRAQCIRPLPAKWQAYKEYIPVTRRFLQVFTPAVVADAYFNGSLRPLINAITRRWPGDAFRRVRQLINEKKCEQALQAIETLELAYRPVVGTQPRVVRQSSPLLSLEVVTRINRAIKEQVSPEALLPSHARVRLAKARKAAEFAGPREEAALRKARNIAENEAAAYPDAHVLALDLAERMEQARRGHVAWVKIHLPQYGSGDFPSRRNIAGEIRRIALILRNYVPDHAKDVRTIVVIFGSANYATREEVKLP